MNAALENSSVCTGTAPEIALRKSGLRWRAGGPTNDGAKFGNEERTARRVLIHRTAEAPTPADAKRPPMGMNDVRSRDS